MLTKNSIIKSWERCFKNNMSKKINPIQKYNFKGNLIKEQDTAGEVIKLLSYNNNIYYITFNNIFTIDENLKIKDIYELNKDNYDIYSDFTFYNNYLVAVGKQYVTFYNLKDNHIKKYSISNLKETPNQEFLVLSSDNHLYLVDLGSDDIYELEIKN